ncbi:phthiocerol/phthiodiolone dimycocerosyl transferase family protein [Nocardia callitridis]|uniref:Phthiocerol/phthiodiolone dimycocerosyl transferase n=1 Tax=Nocardia callitridis TaxID=648753 RepID=A0ABP9L625_9NOCA
MLWDEVEVIRVLAPSEARFVRHGTYTGRSVSVVGALDTAALRSAFVAVLRANPILSCRIMETSGGQGVLVRPRGGDAVGATVADGADDVRLPIEPIDPATQLAYLDITACGPHRWRTTLYNHHSIGDGSYGIDLMAQLWSHYTDLVQGSAARVVPRRYPQSLEWWLAHNGVGKSSVSGLETLTRPLAPAVTDPPADETPQVANSLVRPRYTSLDEASTAALIRLGRRHGVSVNGLLTAALLRVHARETSGASGDPAAVGCLYPVDLRRRLPAPVGCGAGTNMGGLASFAAVIGRSTGLLALAHAICDRLRADLDHGVVQQSAWHFPEFFGRNKTRAFTEHVAITNTGAVPAFRTPEGLTLGAYELVYLSAHPRPSAGPGAAVTFLAYTYAGKLTLGQLGSGHHGLLSAARSELMASLTESGDVFAGAR